MIEIFVNISIDTRINHNFRAEIAKGNLKSSACSFLSATYSTSVEWKLLIRVDPALHYLLCHHFTTRLHPDNSLMQTPKEVTCLRADRCIHILESFR